MADKPRRDPKHRPLRPDKKLSLWPLSVEQAAGAIMDAGPYPQDDGPEQTEDKEKAPPKGRRSVPSSEQS